MSGTPVIYGRNIITTPTGSGITVDGLLIQNGSVGPLSNGLSGTGSVKASYIYNTPISSIAPIIGDILYYDGSFWKGSTTIPSLTLSSPISMNLQAATKQYVDMISTGINSHPAMDVLADASSMIVSELALMVGAGFYTNGTAGIGGAAASGLGIGATLTGSSSGTVLVIDSYTPPLNARVLVNGFTMNTLTDNQAWNGLYYVSQLGILGVQPWVLTRASDSNNSTAGQVMPGDLVYIARGTTYMGSSWILNTNGTGTPMNTIVIGTDPIVFTQFGGNPSCPVLDSQATPTFPLSPITEGVWYGEGTKANTFNNTCLTFGNYSSTLAPNCIALGNNASANGGGISIGSGTSASGSSAVAIGNGANATGSSHIAIGSGATISTVPTVFPSIAIGINTNASGIDNIVIGRDSTTGGASYNTVVGVGNTITGAGAHAVVGITNSVTNSIYANSFGTQNTSSGNNNSVIMGNQCSVINASNSMAIGFGTSAGPNFAIAMGSATSATTTNTIAIGNTAVANAAGSIAIGANTTSNVTSSIAIGGSASTNSIPNSIVLNSTGTLISPVGASNAFAIGVNNSSLTNYTLGLSLGSNIVASNPRQIEAYTTVYGTTVTSATFVKLTPTSAHNQYFTGTISQTILLPAAGSIMNNGFNFRFVNQSTQSMNALTTRETTVTVPATLPQSIIWASSTSSFSASGTIYISTSSGSSLQTINYTAKNEATTTIAAGSAGGTLPLGGGNLNVSNTTGFASSGTIQVTTSNGVQFVTYTSILGNTFVGCNGGTGTMSLGGTVSQINFTGCTGGTGGITTTSIISQVISLLGIISPNDDMTATCVDVTAVTANSGWFMPPSVNTNVSTTIPALIIPNNYGAQQKGVPIGGLYRSAMNGSTTSLTFAITSSFVLAGTTLTVTSTSGTITPGMFLNGGSVTSGTQIINQLTGAAGANGTYQVDISQTAGIAPTSVSYNVVSDGDRLYVRTV